MSGLKRYTQLPHLLHMLTTRSITLLSPNTWDDRNDAHFIARYRESKGLKSVHVLCLTKSPATYHHWHVFAGNASGVRIEFDEAAFREWVSKIKGARLDRVEYIKLDKAVLANLTTDQLPFAKRFAFRDEGEVRLIVDEPKNDAPFKSVPFDHSMIKGVIVSPWLPRPLFSSVEAVIRSVSPGASFKIRPTTMLANSTFMAAGENEA
jgi:hypothetical protein